jgi:hypothetical protein
MRKFCGRVPTPHCPACPGSALGWGLGALSVSSMLRPPWLGPLLLDPVSSLPATEYPCSAAGGLVVTAPTHPPGLDRLRCLGMRLLTGCLSTVCVCVCSNKANKVLAESTGSVYP